MTVKITPTQSLGEFLKLPKTKPASEYINDQNWVDLYDTLEKKK